jgi:MFS family permease
VFGGWLKRTFDSLRYPEFRILWLGTSFAFLTFMMSSTVQNVVAFDLAGTNRAVGLVSLGNGLAMLAIGPMGGVLADRLQKRRLLLVGQSAIAVVFVVNGVLVLSDLITIPALVALTFALGVAFSLTGPTRQAYVGELVPRPALPNAVALSQLPMTVARVVSPLVAGVLIGIEAIGTGGTYVIMAALFVVVLGTLWQLPAGREAAPSGRSVGGDLAAGLGHVRSRPRLALLVTSFILLVMLGFPYQAVLPGFLETELDRPAREVGFLMGVSAAGGIVAAFLASSAAGSSRAWPVMLGFGLVFAGALVAMAFVPGYALALAVMVVVGFGSTGFQMLNNSLWMIESDPAYYGRVMSLSMLAWGSQGLTALPYGALADAIGERETMAVMGVAELLLMAVIGLAAMRQGALGKVRAPSVNVRVDLTTEPGGPDSNRTRPRGDPAGRGG